MKKRVKSILLVMFSVIASLFLFAGCELGETLEEALASRDLTVSVTYYANGGTFTKSSITNNDKNDMCKLYFKADVIPLNIGGGVGDREQFENGGEVISGQIDATGMVSRSYYTFSGWYYAEQDAEGNYIKYDENGNVLSEEDLANDPDLVYVYKSTGVAVDFTATLSKGDYVFVAEWKENPKYIVKLVCLENKDIQIKIDNSDETFEDDVLNYGDFVKDFRFGSDNKTTIDVKKIPFKVSEGEYTLMNYYYDEDCTEVISGEVKRPEDMTEDRTLYLRVVEGAWTFVGDITAFKAIEWNKKIGYWFTNDIDASVLAEKLSVPANFGEIKCQIKGNGFTVKGLRYSQKEIGTTNNISLFGDIGATAKIEDIIFEDIQMEYQFKFNPKSIYVLFTSINEKATVNNVKLQGGMIIDKSSNATFKIEDIKNYDEQFEAVEATQGFQLDIKISEI